MSRLLQTLAGMGREAVQGTRALRSGRVQWWMSIVVYRLLRIVRTPSERTVGIMSRGGTAIRYRLDRGDIQSVREVWLDRTYRLPPGAVPSSIIDLGANIGLTSLWFAETWPGCRIVAVEPVPSNAAVLRANFVANDLDAILLQAAVGPVASVTGFSSSLSSNLGRLDPEGALQVEVIDMAAVLAAAGGHADLVKLDIEGGEGALLEGDLGWLAHVEALLVEFHPEVVDDEHLARLIEEQGFRYYPAGTVVAADYFERIHVAGEA